MLLLPPVALVLPLQMILLYERLCIHLCDIESYLWSQLSGQILLVFHSSATDLSEILDLH